MICVNCEQGQTQTGLVTVRLQNPQKMVTIAQVPAEICPQCGEYYLEHRVAQQVIHQARHGVSSLQQYGLEIASPPIEPMFQVTTGAFRDAPVVDRTYFNS
jgi:YgiT-type zinc finger domain-containing protein